MCEAARPTAADEPERIYRFAHIKLVRALLRVKIVQLGLGVGILAPTASLASTGLGIGLQEGATLAAVVGGTLVAGTTLSWYCERLVGELSWDRRTDSMRIATLTMWGERKNHDITRDRLHELGFGEPPPPSNEFPLLGPAPLEIDGKTYIFVWGRRHVLQPTPLTNMLLHNAVPFPRDAPEMR